MAKNKPESSSPFKSGDRATISSTPKKHSYARGVIPLDTRVPINDFIQFKFTYFKETTKPCRCICQQSKEELEHLDSFFSQSFCRDVSYFKSIRPHQSSGCDCNVPTDPTNPYGDKHSLIHFHINHLYCIHGFYIGNDFFIVSLDPDHSVNPSHKS